MRGRTITRTLALLIGILTLGGPALAEQHQTRVSHLPQGARIEASAYPWSTIGKLNNGVGGSCTAFLISPRFALTAAHCLFFRNTRRYLPAQSIHLVLGYENQHYSRHYRISAYYIPETYHPLRPYETLANDWALLELSTRTHHPPVAGQMLSKLFKIKSEAAVMTAGYSHHTPYAMTADRGCRMLGRSLNGNLLFDTCKAPAGYSGAPIIVSTADKRFSVAGMHVANQLWRTHAIAIAIPIENIWSKIAPCVQKKKCEFQVVSAGRDPTAEELLGNLPNLGYKARRLIASETPCSTNRMVC